MIEAVDADSAPLLARLHAEAFPAPWSAEEMVKLMVNPAVFVLLASANEPQGFVMAWAVAGESEILTIAVVPSARRQGAGIRLMTAAGVAAYARGAATMHLEVAEDNEAARALYAKLGYVEAGRRNAYYSGEKGRVDALLLRRELPRPVV